MDSTIATLLFQDGFTNGMVYALIGIALVLVFSLTRVILLFIGELVGFGALTFAALQADRVPGTIWLLLMLGALATASGLFRARRDLSAERVISKLGMGLGLSAMLAAVGFALAPPELPVFIDVVITFALVVPMGGYIYASIYEPIQGASILTLLITAVGIHLALMTLGLMFFGPDGTRSPMLVTGAFELGGMRITWQAVTIYASTILLMAAMLALFGRTLFGAALRATAVNRLGARLVGIPVNISGQFAFLSAAFIGTLCGLLIGPMTTIYYDTGFVIALKGFVAAVLGGLLSYPVTVAAALGIGQIEAFVSFLASSYKDAIVFATILPVLLLRSVFTHHSEEEA